MTTSRHSSPGSTASSFASAHLNSYSPVRFTFSRQHAEIAPESNPKTRAASLLLGYLVHSA